MTTAAAAGATSRRALLATILAIPVAAAFDPPLSRAQGAADPLPSRFR